MLSGMLCFKRSGFIATLVCMEDLACFLPCPTDCDPIQYRGTEDVINQYDNSICIDLALKSDAN